MQVGLPAWNFYRLDCYVAALYAVKLCGVFICPNSRTLFAVKCHASVCKCFAYLPFERIPAATIRYSGETLQTVTKRVRTLRMLQMKQILCANNLLCSHTVFLLRVCSVHCQGYKSSWARKSSWFIKFIPKLSVSPRSPIFRTIS